MLGRRIRSALYIDFENIALLPDTIPNWLAWLESGEFEVDGRPRRFMVKRVYWNSSAEKHREKYEKQGFEVVLCEKFATLKNGADIRMAMDIIEATHKPPRVDEFILVTKDSDFIPVLQRLGQKSKKTVMLVDEARPQMHTAYRQHADIIIPVRKLMEATKFVQPRRGLIARLTGGSRTAKSARSPAVKAALATTDSAASAPAPVGGAAKAGGNGTAAAKKAEGEAMEAAVNRVIKVTSRNPKKDTASKKIMAELRLIPGFTNTGPAGFLGKGSFQALMKDIAKRDGRIKVNVQKRGGIGVQYVPGDEVREDA